MSELHAPLPAETDSSNRGKRWTPADDADLGRAFTEGETPALLATRFGRTESAIIARLQHLDIIAYGPYTALINGRLPLPPTTDDGAHRIDHWTDPEIVQLLTAHHTFGTPEALVELAATLKRTPRALALKLVHMGLVVPGVNPAPVPPPLKPSKPSKTAPLPTPSTRTVKVTITPEFKTAWQAIEAGENLLILGSAGTGKSTFLRWIKHQMNSVKSYAVVAPTGMAALNVGGQTIHSFFGLKTQLLSGKADWHKPRNPKIYDKLQLLVIDEISMVRADVFTALEAFLRTFGPRPGRPFGGVQIVAMGDIYQLPPVVRGDESMFFRTVFETPFFFSSPAWEQGAFGLVEFTHVFRQSDAPFISLLNAVRHGKAGHDILSSLNARLTSAPPDDAIVLAARNKTVDTLNQEALTALPGLTRTYMATISGNMDPDTLTTPLELNLKVGARVMFTRNDPNGRWVNGSLGTVTRCDTATVNVRLDDGIADHMAGRGETYVVEPTRWEATKFMLNEETQALEPQIAGTFSQLPLTLAWAVTIHKAQGQTLPKCVLNLGDGGTFAEGQLYVALSRARSLESLYLTHPVQARHIRVHPAIQQFVRECGV